MATVFRPAAAHPTPTPAAVRAAYLQTLHEAAPQILQSLLDLMPNDRLVLRSFRASRVFRDHPDELEDPVERERYGLARAEWLARLVTWGAAWYLPAWAVEAAEETLEVRRLMLLYEMKEPVPRAWVPSEGADPALPPGVTRAELLRFVRYQHLQTSMSQLAWSERAHRQDTRIRLRGTADALGVKLRPPSRGGRRKRGGDGRQLGLLPPVLRALPVKGTVR